MCKKLKNLVLVFVIAFAFSTTAMAVDIAISTQANWWSQGAADREMQEIVDNVTAVSIEVFPSDQQDALADWVAAHTGDGLSDLLILCGQFPATIYTAGNAQADDSLAELFLDDGNTIVNTGDYMFYVVDGAGTNAAGGLQAMMDISGTTMWDDDTAVVVTAEGQEFTPSLVDYATDRPFHLDELQGDWGVELILAGNAAGTRADPVIVVNTDTGGRLGIFYQTSGQDNDPRGEVISEWINNWYIPNVAGGGGNPLARRPDPEDGAFFEETWGSLSWRPGNFAVSHDVYVGDNFDDVNNGAADTFVGNQGSDTLIVGFVGFPFPDGLVPGTTYYWRIDEVNDANAASPWKGDVWSFSVPPRTAYNPDPADGAGFVDPNAVFTWTPGFGAKLHNVYMGTNFDDVSNAAGAMPLGDASYSPATLESEKVYYWRVDELDPPFTHKGDVWSFTTPGAVGNPQPANGAVDVQMSATLSWTAADNAASHELYFGADADVVKNATTASPEYIGPRALGAESYDPGGLAWDSSYAWRVDEVYPDGTVKGLVWSFATADFISVDDFEAYNDIEPPAEASNRIFDKWIDGFGTTDNGALIGNDLPPYAEQTIVHGGAQSMIYRYDNANKTSEATMTLVYPRDWTAEGVTKLSLWFRGSSANSADRMFVALGNATVYHPDAAATQITGWNEWVIDLTEFAGVDLTNVGSITIGIGTRNAPAAGDVGTMYFDDVRLVR